MTTVYFIRHAQSDRFTQDDKTRPLTELGLSDTVRITEKLLDNGISHIISSPYKRTVQTVSDLSEKLSLDIETDEDFRERNAGSWQGEHFLDFIKAQWADFGYRILDGECLFDVQKRNISALNKYLALYRGETIAIATHGTALSTMLNYFDKNYNADSFFRIMDFMPYVVKIDFDDNNVPVSFEEILIVERPYK